MRRKLASLALGLLTVGGVLSMYALAFSFWMTAYPYADVIVWRTRFYQRLALTGIIGLLWVVMLRWWLLHRPRAEDRKLVGR